MSQQNEYISIAEFAKRAGVSVQAVYKRVEKDFKPWLKVENGKKSLNIKALRVFDSTKVSTEVDNLSTKVSTEVESGNTLKMALDLLAEQNETLRKQLEAKDRQIEAQTEQIARLTAALENATASLNAAQALHAGTIQQQLTAGSTEPAEAEPSPARPKHWWQRLGK